MFNRGRLRDMLAQDEGYRTKPYKDTVGKLSIGIGRNPDDVGLRPAEVEFLFNNDVDAAEKLLDDRLSWWRKLDDARQLVLMDMAFNMGGKLFTFVNTLAAVKRGDYAVAAKGMRQSLWYKQVGARAERLARLMELGDGGAG